jgi:HlyD family secretion protein
MKRPSRAALFSIVGIVIVAAAVLAFRSRAETPKYMVAKVDRGDIVDVVGATGLLQAVVTVQVGSQVSGNIQELNADFNSQVKKGQVIARLDPSTFQARLAQAQANAASARANADRAQAAVEDARQKYARAKELAAENLLPATDLETAKSTFDAAVAQLRANEAAVKQAAAAVNQAAVDVEHTVIYAPVDGVVLARNVELGQTVAASLQAPTLFIIANDLTHMQVNASIDEADIGRVKQGQHVTFRVDAYPDRTFEGRIEQVRLQPVTANNVVTYNTIISVENKDQKLMPGMTATVSVEVNSRPGVLRLPATALRFRPEGYEPPQRTGGPGGAGAGGGQGGGQAAAGGGPGAAPGAGAGGPGGPGAGGGFGGPGQRGGRRDGSRPDGSRAGGGDGTRPRPAVVFQPGPDGEPKAQPVRLGLSDGRFVEVVEGLNEGDPVITGTDATGGRTAAAGPGGAGGGNNSNPFAQPRFTPRTR